MVTEADLNPPPPPEQKPPRNPHRATAPLGSSRNSDPLVVLTEELAILVEAFIEKHSQGVDSNTDDVFTGSEYLSHWSGIDPRTIRAIRSHQTKWTSYRNADRLMAAMGLTHLFGVYVHVRPNPRWSNERYQAYLEEQLGCCAE